MLPHDEDPTVAPIDIQSWTPVRRTNRKPRIGWPSPSIPGVCEIPLTRGKIALIDESDFAAVSRWSWYASPGTRTWYAKTTITDEPGKYTLWLMHVFLVRPGSGLQVDHIDGDGLNNRRENLRVCTGTQNGRNQRPQVGRSSRYKGVYLEKKSGHWAAQIHIDGRCLKLGTFDLETDAALAYDFAAIRHFGEFAQTNASHFPEVAALSVSEEELGARCHRAIRMGEDSPTSRLVTSQVREIRARCGVPGACYARLADEYGVNHDTIRDIAVRRTWKHIE